MSQPPIHRIRNALVRSSQVAKLKLDATFLRRERDRLLMEPDVDSTIAPKNNSASSKGINFHYQDGAQTQ